VKELPAEASAGAAVTETVVVMVTETVVVIVTGEGTETAVETEDGPQMLTDRVEAGRAERLVLH
jgi:hypothetical protein